MKNKQLWFKAKMYGWGWQPVSWQGWVITLLYLAAIVQFAIQADKNSHSASDTLISLAIPFIVTTVFLLIICYTKGERPEWRWNGRKIR